MRQEINLYPPELRNEGDWPSARALVVAGLLLVLLLLVVMAVHTAHLFVVQAEIIAKHDAQAEVQQRIDVLSGKIMPEESDADFEAKVQEIEARIAKRDRLRRVLKGDVATGSGGYSEHFIGLARQAVPGVWLTYLSIRGAGQAMTLRGRAFDAGQIPHYLERLAQEPVFSNIQINSLRLEKAEAAPALEWNDVPTACCEFSVETGGS